MSQERMHPDDLRAIMAAIVAAPKGWVGPLPEAIDRLLADLARTAKPEAPKEDPSRPFRVGDRVRIKNSPYKDVNGCEGEIIPLPKHPQKGGTYRGTINVMTFDKSMQVLTYLPDELELLNALEADTEPEFLAWRKKAWDNASRAEKAEATLRRLGYPEDGRKSMWKHVLDRAENAEARVKELEDEIRRHQISFPSLVRPSKADARLWELVK